MLKKSNPRHCFNLFISTIRSITQGAPANLCVATHHNSFPVIGWQYISTREVIIKKNYKLSEQEHMLVLNVLYLEEHILLKDNKAYN